MVKTLLKNQKLALTLLTIFWLVAVLRVRADFSPNEDAFLFKQAGQCFLDAGLACSYNREPLYPLFLSLLLKLRLDLTIFIPIFQNIFFLIATVLFVREAFRIQGQYERVLKISIFTALIPTFLITVNGAAYAESLLASLIMMQLALLTRGFYESRVSQPIWVRSILWFGVACISGALGLLKASFPLIEFVFAIVLISGCLALSLSRKYREFIKFQNIIPLILALALGGPIATNIWFAARSSLSQSSFYRGGIILYGRTEYAKQFNWRKDFLPFITEALSDKGCRAIFADQCQQYTFEAENNIGILALQGATDTELFNLGKENILNQPLLQLSFVPMEWMRFFLHHGTTGFAHLEVPIIGPLIHSFGFNLILKLFNLGLYFYFISLLWRRKFQARPIVGILACYIIAYLSIYGFVTTVVRYIYPIAPFIVILFFDHILQAKETPRIISFRQIDPISNKV